MKSPATENIEPIISPEARDRRKLLSDSFNLGAQTLEEATCSASKMVESLETRGLLLRP